MNSLEITAKTLEITLGRTIETSQLSLSEINWKIRSQAKDDAQPLGLSGPK